MGKRTLSTELKNNPTVRLADRLGSRFVGRYIGSKDITIKSKPSKLHEFNALEGDALITVKEGDAYKEASISEGDVVSVFGSVAIDTALSEAKAGETIEIVFNGQKKTKSGNKFNDYAVAVLED